MTPKLISVVIPTYGRPHFLKRAIESVRAQTYKNVEIIVVDDNDPQTETRQQTAVVMKEYESFDNIIYLQHEFNKNGSAARNTGLRIAKGDYITFLDDDDEMRPQRLATLYNKMESLDETWICCYSGFSKLKANGSVDICGENRSGELYREALMRSLYFCPGSNLFARTEYVRKINGFDEDFSRNQDLEFLARLLEFGKLANVAEDTLIIHYENRKKSVKKEEKEQEKKQYEDLVALDNFYLCKFESRIKELPNRDQKKIYQYFALERFRYSIRFHNCWDGMKNCINNHVTIWVFIRYSFYMLYRFATKKSIGFRI